MQLEKQQIAHRLYRYWLYENNQQLVVFEPIGTSRETVDGWREQVERTAAAWDRSKPYLEIHDMRQSSVTPYSREKALELVQALVDYEGRSAIVLPPSLLGHVMRFFVERVLNREKQKLERRVFTSMDAAIAWVSAYRQK